jgi:hypothetical protein
MYFVYSSLPEAIRPFAAASLIQSGTDGMGGAQPSSSEPNAATKILNLFQQQVNPPSQV